MLKKMKNQNTAVNTASLPDIVFMLLFFFMTVTVIKEDTLMVENSLPNATEVKELQHRDLVIDLYLGKPVEKYETSLGSQPKIQIDDKFVELSQLGSKILEKQNEMPEALRPKMIIALKVDRDAQMGLLADLKEELRKVNALKIRYIALEQGNLEN